MTLAKEIDQLFDRQKQEVLGLFQRHLTGMLSGITAAMGGAAAPTAGATAAPAKRGRKAKAAGATTPAAAKPAKTKKGRAPKTPPHLNVDLAYETARLANATQASSIKVLADALGKTTEQLSIPIRIAVERGWVTKSGERRATVYHPGKLPGEKPADASPPVAAEPAAAAAPSNGSEATAPAPDASTYASGFSVASPPAG